MKTVIFIDRRNREHVRWWNKIGFKLVKTRLITKLADVDSGKEIGYLLEIKGVLKHFVARKNNRFITDSKEFIF